jgi:hypothetical protein
MVLIEGWKGIEARAEPHQVMGRTAGGEVVALHHFTDPQVDVGAHLGLDEVAACQ